MDQYTAFEDRSAAAATMDVAMTPFKPSTHLWAYGTVPGMWSGTKGLYIPFNTSSSKKYLGEAGALFKDKNYLAGLGKGFKGTVGSVRPFGVGGSRILPFGDKLAKNERIVNQIRRRTAKDWERYTSLLLKEDAFKKEKITTILNAQKSGGGVIRRPGKVKNKAWLARRKKFDDIAFNAAEDMRKYSNKLSMLESRMKNDKTVINKLIGKRAGLKIGKWSFRAGKAVSIVGAAMLAIDLTRMVGEPLGRAVVSEVDQALTSWEDRFMPEVGGRLEMTYLSRGAATDRQRALQAMQKAQITGRSAFGQESKYVHQ